MTERHFTAPVTTWSELHAGEDKHYRRGHTAGHTQGWSDAKAGNPRANIVRTGDPYREGYADGYDEGYTTALADSRKRKT